MRSATAQAKVRQQPLLQLLDDAEADKLLASGRPLHFGRGEKDAPGRRTGGIDVHPAQRPGCGAGPFRRSRYSRRHPPSSDYCGENVWLLTGEPRSATVVARTDCELWEIDKPVLAELLQKNETLVQKLGDLLANRRLEREGVLSSEAEKKNLHAKEKGIRSQLHEEAIFRFSSSN